MRSETITLKWLKQRCVLNMNGASCQALETFAAEWPNGAKLTKANLLRAAELNLDLEWFAACILSAKLWAEFYRQRKSFQDEFYRQVAPFRVEFDRQKTPFWPEYKRQTAPFWEEFRRQVAKLLWKIISEGEEK